MTSTAPILYVYAVSDYTLPIYEACLNIRPRELLLIISRSKLIQESAQRLIKLLEADMPQCQVTALGKDGDGPDGDEPTGDLHWLQAHLRPLLDERKALGLQPVLNITGGTKGFALALQACFEWPRIDYLAYGKPLQAYHLIHANDKQSAAFAPIPTGFASQAEGDTPDKPWVVITPEQLASLYNEDFQKVKPNRIDSRPAAAELAKKIWEAQSNRDSALKLLFEALDHVWTSEEQQYQSGLIELPWKEFFSPTETDPQQGYAQCLLWLQQFCTLNQVGGQDNGTQPILSFDTEHIKLPGNKFNQSKADKERRDWKDWVSGIWLECAAHDFLLKAGIPKSAIARGILAGDDKRKSESMREADLLIHHQHRSTLIEIKAGLPPGTTLAQQEQQISSLNKFGKVNKGLLLGPAFRQRLERENRLESFQLRCKANQVTLLQDLDSLLSFVLGKRSNPQPTGPATA